MSKILDPSNYVNDVFLQDVPKVHTIIYHEHQMHAKDGLNLLTECPVCHRQKWTRKSYIDLGHTKSTYCFDHKYLLQIRWLPDGSLDQHVDVLVDYAQQKASESAIASGKRVVFIIGMCPGCRSTRWIRVSGIRNHGNTTYCMSCAKKHSSLRNPLRKTSGGITTSGGYTYIHIDTLGQRYSPEDIHAIRSHIRSSHNRYYPEHRVVALLKYGPLFFADDTKTVVRHINGDKQDNRPENLVLGSQGDNVNDHTTDRALAKKWRGIALELAKALQICLATRG